MIFAFAYCVSVRLVQRIDLVGCVSLLKQYSHKEVKVLCIFLVLYLCKVSVKITHQCFCNGLESFCCASCFLYLFGMTEESKADTMSLNLFNIGAT